MICQGIGGMVPGRPASTCHEGGEEAGIDGIGGDSWGPAREGSRRSMAGSGPGGNHEASQGGVSSCPAPFQTGWQAGDAFTSGKNNGAIPALAG